ncbi:MAG: DNA polymerase III subunit delta, partial [Dehalococcoidales bacterium]
MTTKYDKIGGVLIERQTLLYILSGQDDFTLHQSLDAVKSDVGDQFDLSSSTTTLEGQKLTLDELRTVCETVPFLSGKRLVIVSGLLERFGPQRRPRRQGKAGQSKNQADKHAEFSNYIKTIPETTVLVLIDSEVKGGNPLLKDLAAGATVKSFPLLREPQLREWVQKRVKEAGAGISPGAANLLTRMVGSNLWIMASEIDKLLLFTSGSGIEEDDVHSVVSYTQQANVFTMVDAIMEFRAEQAEQLLQRLLNSGAAPAYLMT